MMEVFSVMLQIAFVPLPTNSVIEGIMF